MRQYDVNFVAHAVVAAREGGRPPYAFGAMVPDLRAFTDRAEIVAPPVDAGDVEAGERSHHRIDSAFHANGQFRSWTAVIAIELGNERAARAAAHVAVELTIDGVLLDTERAGAFYDALAWADASLDGPWHALVSRLRSDDLVRAYCTPEGVARRTVGAIGRRPRLRRHALDEGALAVAVGHVRPRIAAELDELLAALG
ncbi:MAG: hypothetical protein QOI47_545 [Actinomycetota bacterium]|nr:hypothetical protein [Actinomycetota bacterium]